jgi:hypothetical protein
MALLSVSDPNCPIPGIAGAAMQGSQEDDIRQQSQRAAGVITRGTSGSPNGAAIARVVDDMLHTIENAITSGKLFRAWGYTRELQRLAAYAASGNAVVREVEQQISTGRRPDAAVTLVVNGGFRTLRLVLEIKNWTLPKLTNDTEAVQDMANQVADLARDPDNDGVILEFVQTSTNKITQVGQIIERLRGAGVDLSRIQVRLVGATDPTPAEFVPSG